MKAKETTETPLRIFGIDRIIAVLNETGIPHQELAKWDEQQLETTLHQLNPGSPSKRIPDRLKKDLMKTQHIRENTLFISDNPRMISRMTGKDMALVLGLDLEANNQKALYESGADLVLESMEDFKIISGNHQTASFTQSFQSAFQYIENHRATLDQQRPLFFFDYDGTLAPIQSDPDKAFMPEQMRRSLELLAQKFRVSIVSGRDMKDLKDFVQLESLIYAGSHGFRIAGPGDIQMQHDQTKVLLPQLDDMTDLLQKTDIFQQKGIEIERKHLAIAIHYRNAAKGSYRKLYSEIKRLIKPYEDFKMGHGKKILEIRPSIPWHKGKAVHWITEKLQEIDQVDYFPVYMGDDITDEDAFKSISQHGLGILVGEHDQPSAAHCQLRDVSEVQKLIHYLTKIW